MFVPVDATEMPMAQNYGVGTPDEERRRQMEAFQATIAKKRSVPQTIGGATLDRGDAAPGSYIQMGGGQGDYVNSRDLGSLAQSGNIDAMMALRRRMQEDERPMRMNETMGDRMGRADQAFAQMMGLGAQAFDADTKRAAAGIQELEAKVGGTQRLESAERIAREQGANQLKVAEISRRTALDAPRVQAALAKLMDPAATPEEKMAAQNVINNIERGGSLGPDPKPGKGAADSRGDVKVDGGSGSPPPAGGSGLDDLKKMEDATKKGNLQRSLLAEATGRTVGPGGVLTGQMKFDPGLIADVLARRGDAVTPEAMSQLVRDVRESGLSTGDQMVSDAFRKYMDLSRLAGAGGGVGEFQIEAGPMGRSMFGQGGGMTRISNPDIGQIMLRETPGNRINVGGFTEEQRQRHASQARAMSAFLKAWLQSGGR